LHAEKIVQLIDGLARAGFGREHGEKLLQFVIVEPQAVAAGTFVERERRRARVLDLDFVKGGIAPWTEMRTALGFGAFLALKFQEGIVGVSAGALHDGFEFTGAEPETAAFLAEMDVEMLEMQDKQGHVTFWADAFHVRQSLGNGMMVCAGRTRQALPGSAGVWMPVSVSLWLMKHAEWQGVIYNLAGCL